MSKMTIAQRVKKWRIDNRARYNMQERVRRWRRSDGVTTVFKTEGALGLPGTKLWVVARIDEEMLKYIPQEEGQDAVIEAARRNGWLKRPTLE